MRSAVVAVTALLLLPLAGAAQPAGHDHGASPYAGLESRTIKALSDEEIQDLLAGEGMGFALAAELNGHPGPRHVLELADSLALTADQRAETEAVMRAMLAEAERLGARIVDAERALDAAFAAATIEEDALRAATGELGALRGELRAVHLAAHLSVRRILTPHQVHRYVELRGYAPAGPHPIP